MPSFEMLTALTLLPLLILIYFVYSVCLSVRADVLMCIGMLQVVEPANQFSLHQHRTSASLATGTCLHVDIRSFLPSPWCGRRPLLFPQSEIGDSCTAKEFNNEVKKDA